MIFEKSIFVCFDALCPSQQFFQSCWDGSSSDVPVPGFIQAYLSQIQGLNKDSHSVFKDYNFMKNTNLHYKILLMKI